MIAIAFGPATMAEALDGLPRIREAADCVELRLDYFEESFDLPRLLLRLPRFLVEEEPQTAPSPDELADGLAQRAYS